MLIVSFISKVIIKKSACVKEKNRATSCLTKLAVRPFWMHRKSTRNMTTPRRIALRQCSARHSAPDSHYVVFWKSIATLQVCQFVCLSVCLPWCQNANPYKKLLKRKSPLVKEKEMKTKMKFPKKYYYYFSFLY